MSAVPASPRSPDSCSSAVGHLVGAQALVLLEPQQEPWVDGARARGHHQPLEWGEAHRGVHRAAVEHCAERCARAEVAGHDPAGVAAARGSSGVGVREAVEAVAAHASARASSRERVRGGLRRSVAWNAVSKQATAGTSGSARADRVERSERLGWWSGASAISSRSAASHVLVDRPLPREASRRRGRRGGRRRRDLRQLAERGHRRLRLDSARGRLELRRPRSLSSASSNDSFRLLDPALTTRTRTSAASPDAARGLLAAGGHPARSSRARRAGRRRARGCRRGGAAARRPSAGAAPRPARRARHAVDHVHHEVEAVEVVQHDHVERRRGRALLLVAAHVEVGVVACAGT